MKIEALINDIGKLKAPSSEINILIWLLFGERLGVTIADKKGYFRYGELYSFKPSEVWNGRTLKQALEWCYKHNRGEIDRVARDWGVPNFTGNIQDCMMLIPKRWKLIFLGEWEKRPGKGEGPWVARLKGPMSKAGADKDPTAGYLNAFLPGAAFSAACIKAAIRNGDIE